MKVAWVVVAIAVALSLESILARYAIVAGPTVDLVLVLVVYVALTAGPARGMLTGTVGGLAQDALSGGVIGVGGLAKTVVGFLAGVAASQFIVTRPLTRFMAFFVATIVHALCYGGLYSLLSPAREFAPPYRAVLAQAVGIAIVGLVAFQVAQLLPELLQRRSASRARADRRRLGAWGRR